MTQLFTNNASGTNSVQVEVVDTTVSLQAGEGALFPSPSGSNFFTATIEDTSGNIEIVVCTSRATDVLTVTRAQESTTALVFSTGSRVELRVTAATFGEFIQQSGDAMTGELDLNSNILRDPLITDGEARNLTLRGTDGGTANQIIVPTAAGDPTIGGNVIVHAGNDSAYVQTTYALTGGEGIAAIGDLSAPRTVDLAIDPLANLNASTFAPDDKYLIFDTSAGTHKKVTDQGGGTRVVALTSSRNGTIVDSNALVYGDATNRVFTLTDSVYHVGAEIALIAPAAGTITIAVSGAQTVNSLSSNVIISADGGGAYLAQYATNTWILVGDLE